MFLAYICIYIHMYVYKKIPYVCMCVYVYIDVRINSYRFKFNLKFLNDLSPPHNHLLAQTTQKLNFTEIFSARTTCFNTCTYWRHHKFQLIADHSEPYSTSRKTHESWLLPHIISYNSSVCLVLLLKGLHTPTPLSFSIGSRALLATSSYPSSPLFLFFSFPFPSLSS